MDYMPLTRSASEGERVNGLRTWSIVRQQRLTPEGTCAGADEIFGGMSRPRRACLGGAVFANQIGDAFQSCAPRRSPRLRIDIEKKAVRFHRLPQFPHGGI